ncbi:Deoxynucleotidyltransferase terminal-interacting protein 1 [Desmophyllum pertusum]|uniref:Deoxynucleotidyltransferase terminal-interacting protein 1 n=1 Tax=Desmophyllum pertusum TaxID=174260 RepID=A0A9W9ZUX6_9CNID|nr:Deoxynucleotidyltransferase terminal-interacting protein 1 [Desmophyllum pertusum]
MNTDDRYGFRREFRKQKLSFRDMDTSLEDQKESKKGKSSQECEHSPFNMTAKNFPKRRSRMHASVASYNRTRGSTVSANKALELVRAALQPSLNAEIEAVLKSYQEMFRMAARNIKDNTSESVSEEQIKAVLRRSLDEAKVLFRVDTKTHHQDRMRYERGGSPAIVKKKRARPNGDKESDGSPAKSNKVDTKVITSEWDPDSINEDTEFIMGVKANKALGFAATRGKLYYRHPELFKYSGDSDDKLWLYEQNELPITGGKAFLMIANDIRKLAVHHDYRNNEGLNLEEIKGFKVPLKMLEKMKNHMRRLKREATARSEVRDKVKEDKPAAVKEEKEPEQQEHNKTPPQATQAGAMK